ncbi:MAG: dTDP-4-dehydrorhamnose 3,5-epimerase [Ignavibacteria bacterium]|nr:dTDP-4-dehydrorhamnose 3,5-epimerase [Ignavibacteria bacterium]
MKISKTEFPGLLIIEPNVFSDSRGYFFESYNQAKLNEINFTEKFVQDNFAKSCKGTVRGLHYQVGEFAQGKLCQVIKGSVLDVAVDIRFGSPTFGKYFSIELNEENHLQLWIPKGFAHGYSVLVDETIFFYKCTNFYNKASERAIIYNDTDLNVDWKVKDPIVSEKDRNAKKFCEIDKDFIYKSSE